MMKRLFAALIAAFAIAGTMTACGEKTFECAMCEETFEGKGHTVKYEGKKSTLCDDCYEWYELSEELVDALLED